VFPSLQHRRSRDVARHEVWSKLDALKRHIENLADGAHIKVLATPATPTRRQWPRVKIAPRICSTTSAWTDHHPAELVDHLATRLTELREVIADAVL